MGWRDSYRGGGLNTLFAPRPAPMQTKEGEAPVAVEETGLKRLFVGYQPRKNEEPARSIWDTPRSYQRFSPCCTLYSGPRNAGKTLTMTVVNRMFQKLDQGGVDSSGVFHPGSAPYMKLATNYAVSFADWTSPTIMDDILMHAYKPLWLRLLLDEIHSAASNRRTMTSKAINLEWFLSMVRKLKVEVDFTTQFTSQVNSNLLQQVNAFVRPHKYREGRILKLEIFDFFGDFTNRGYALKRWPPLPSDASRVLIIGEADGVWNMYDTDQIIVAETLPDDIKEQLYSASWKEGDQRDYEHEIAPAVEQAIEERPIHVQEEKKVAFKDTLSSQFMVAVKLADAKRAGVIKADGGIKEFSNWLASEAGGGYKIVNQGHTVWAELRK